jgi:hypothetical protein
MEHSFKPRVESVDKSQEGIIVTFEDGTSAVFSAALLYSMLSQAQQVIGERGSEPQD